VLDGYGWFLKDQTSRISSVNKFLRKVPEYQVFSHHHAPHDKGLCHEMDIFFEGLNILIVLSVYELMVFTVFFKANH
jgi:hypothetical protein